MNWCSLENLAGQLLMHLADASVRATALALMAAGLVLFLRRSSSAQHAMWTAVLIGMLTLPLLRPIIPAAHLAVPQRAVPDISVGRRVPVNSPIDSGVTSAPPAHLPAPPGGFRLWWALYAAAAYTVGALWFAARLMIGMLLTRRLWRGTRSIRQEVAKKAGVVADAGVDLHLEESDRVRVPLTTGLNRVRVILPTEWREWSVETLRVVLAHELAHVRRRDSSIALVAAVNKCVFWFHPLAWWLERRLSVLAEHAADDTALAASSNPETYARVVLEVASRMQKRKGRLIWHGAGMNGALIEQRIRRVMDAGRRKRAMRLGAPARVIILSSAALLIWVSTAVDFQSMARAQATGSKSSMDGRTLVSYLSDDWRPDSTTAEQAAQMEHQLAANPEDEAIRARLIRYYWRNKVEEQRVRLVLWLIDHHPDSAIHGQEFAAIFSRGRFGESDYSEDARGRWLVQVNQHPDDPQVLWNAARAVGDQSLRDEIDLLKRARTLDPARGTEPLAFVDSLVLVWSAEKAAFQNEFRDPAVAGQIRSELQDSNDVALVGAVARHVVEDTTQKALGRDRDSWDFNALRSVAMELVTHALVLEPQNREWSDLMEGAKRLGSVIVLTQRAPATG